ncbi:MAG: hypothetical protein AAF242_17285 [Bacteroidota bacterium]
MELDQLKADWQVSGKDMKIQDELALIAKAKQHPSVKRFRIQFIIEMASVVLFSAVFYDGFDGASKPLWAQLSLGLSIAAYLFVRLRSWYTLRNPIQGENLKTSLQSFRYKLKRMALLIRLTSFIFGSAIILFFTSSVDLTREKYFILFGMMFSLFGMIYLAQLRWKKRIKSIELTLFEFD